MLCAADCSDHHFDFFRRLIFVARLRCSAASASVPPQTALLAMSDSDDFDLSDDEMADEGTAATVPLRPLHASRAAPPRCCCAPPTGARTGGL